MEHVTAGEQLDFFAQTRVAATHRAGRRLQRPLLGPLAVFLLDRYYRELANCLSRGRGPGGRAGAVAEVKEHESERREVRVEVSRERLHVEPALRPEERLHVREHLLYIRAGEAYGRD